MWPKGTIGIQEESSCCPSVMGVGVGIPKWGQAGSGSTLQEALGSSGFITS